MPLRVGIHLNQTLPADVSEQARLAEDLGFHAVWFADAFWPPDGLDVTAVVGLALQATSRISVGINVFNAAIRRAQDMARLAASLEGLFPGRFVLGVGAGRSRLGREIADAWGYPLLSSTDQLAYLAEGLAYLERYFAEPIVSFLGRHIKVEGAQGSPFLSGRRPPMLVAGHTDDVLRLVAQHADLWEGTAVWKLGARAGDSRTEFFLRTREKLRGFCKAIGRDPSTLRVCQTLYVAIGASRREAELIATRHHSAFTTLSCVGTPPDLIASLAELSVSGVDEVQLVPLDRVGRPGATESEALRMIGEEVLPAIGGTSLRP